MCLAIPGRIESIQGDSALARFAMVNFSGARKEVSLAYVPQAVVGDYVIVHVGFALSIVNEAEANRVFEFLDDIGELEELKQHEERPPDSEEQIQAQIRARHEARQAAAATETAGAAS